MTRLITSVDRRFRPWYCWLGDSHAFYSHLFDAFKMDQNENLCCCYFTHNYKKWISFWDTVCTLQIWWPFLKRCIIIIKLNIEHQLWEEKSSNMQQFNSSKINGIDVFYDVLLMDFMLLPYQFNAYFSRINCYKFISLICLEHYGGH